MEVDDPDFGTVKLTNPWTLTEKDILDVIKQRPGTDKCTYDTRTMVVEDIFEDTETDGTKVEIPYVAGGFAYEIQPDGYEIKYIVAPGEDVFVAALDHIKERAGRSEKRKRVTLFLRDSHDAGLRELLPLVVSHGFTVKLVPGHFGNQDAWKASFVGT